MASNCYICGIGAHNHAKYVYYSNKYYWTTEFDYPEDYRDRLGIICGKCADRVGYWYHTCKTCKKYLNITKHFIGCRYAENPALNSQNCLQCIDNHSVHELCYRCNSELIR